MGGNDDAVVGDVKQSVCRLDPDRLAGEVAPHVVAMLEDADPALLVNAAADDGS